MRRQPALQYRLAGLSRSAYAAGLTLSLDEWVTCYLKWLQKYLWTGWRGRIGLGNFISDVEHQRQRQCHFQILLISRIGPNVVLASHLQTKSLSMYRRWWKWQYFWTISSQDAEDNYSKKTCSDLKLCTPHIKAWWAWYNCDVCWKPGPKKNILMIWMLICFARSGREHCICDVTSNFYSV